MSYMALYRKWRPSGFEDVKGQEHIVVTLQNQIKANRIGHAYLFCGTRGTGKTTVAKILAKAVNCEKPIDGKPCEECTTCKSIIAHTSLNVIEIDAASNNGVDNIREIANEVMYSPTEGKYKVYIIDEVHMLSTGAFNAFLKTLEEPPPYVIFILATTEVHKIPVTILSRCQRYDFKRITIDTISSRLSELLKREEAEAEDKAVRYIAKLSDGSMRDAISLLDKCMAYYLGEKLTYDNVVDVLGVASTEFFGRILKSVVAGDVTGCIYGLEELIIDGKELSQFVLDFTWYLRNILLIKTSDKPEEAIDMSTENLLILKSEAEIVETDTLMRYIRIFSELSTQIRYTTGKRVIVELALIKLCKPAMEANYESLLSRLDIIESRLEKGIVTTNVPIESTNKEQPIKAKPVIIPKALPEDIKELLKNWNNIIAMTHGKLKTVLADATLSLGSDNELMLVFKDELDKEIMDKNDTKEELESIIENQINKKVNILTKVISSENKTQDQIIDIRKIINMDIEYED